ncbi:MAG: response regulator [Cyclobacteriaceae bacterium]|nr:response regulator [Cyclobacteriaceae bacterium]
MNNLQITIVEDELIVSEDLRQILLDEGYDVTGCFETAEEALEHLKAVHTDLVMIDIRLKGQMTGVNLAESLRKSQALPIIYVTANTDEETYQLARKTKPQAFLVKPFNARTLLAAVDLALFNFSENNTAETILDAGALERKDFQVTIQDGFFIREGGRHKKIRLSDLLFIEADGSYARLVTNSGQHTITQNLSTFLRKTSLPLLVRVHRSYIINVNRVDSFDEGYVYIDKYPIPISKTYRGDFLSTLNAL